MLRPLGCDRRNELRKSYPVIVPEVKVGAIDFRAELDHSFGIGGLVE